LSQILKKIDNVKGVIGVSRIGDEVSRPAAGASAMKGKGQGPDIMKN
jgi:hypothetical protein